MRRLGNQPAEHFPLLTIDTNSLVNTYKCMRKQETVALSIAKFATNLHTRTSNADLLYTSILLNPLTPLVLARATLHCMIEESDVPLAMSIRVASGLSWLLLCLLQQTIGFLPYSCVPNYI